MCIKDCIKYIYICCCSVTQSCLTLCNPWTAAHQASLSLTISRSLLKLMSIESVMPSNHLILSHPLLLPSVFPSIRVFSNELTHHIRWPKYWSCSFSISPSNEDTQTRINIDNYSFIHSSGFVFGNLNELFGQPYSYTNKMLFVIDLKCNFNWVSWIFSGIPPSRHLCVVFLLHPLG